jgi:tRNA (guanine-N7-)-methyltransferase
MAVTVLVGAFAADALAFCRRQLSLRPPKHRSSDAVRLACASPRFRHPPVRWHQPLLRSVASVPAPLQQPLGWTGTKSSTSSTTSCRMTRREEGTTATTTTTTTEIIPGSGDTDPWSHPRGVADAGSDRRTERGRNNRARFRQHVNPLARRFQQPCQLPHGWPSSHVFDDPARPLHLDIGCGKGGFLVDLARSRGAATSGSNSTCMNSNVNYLGLEIRPLVAQYARERLASLQRNETTTTEAALSGRIEILGCNVNVDLDRILTLYARASCPSSADSTGDDGSAPSSLAAAPTKLGMVTIQFPDPHFKSYHAKRRVVNPDLVRVLARHLVPGSGQVFLQSDVRSVLDDMREQFAAHPGWFRDLSTETAAAASSSSSSVPDGYLPTNIFGVSTEREVSVLERGMPVYRAWFERTPEPFRS